MTRSLFSTFSDSLSGRLGATSATSLRAVAKASDKAQGPAVLVQEAASELAYSMRGCRESLAHMKLNLSVAGNRTGTLSGVGASSTSDKIGKIDLLMSQLTQSADKAMKLASGDALKAKLSPEEIQEVAPSAPRAAPAA